MADIPDLNIFMMCEALDRSALSALPEGFQVRSCRPEEYGIWKAMPFDDAETAAEYDGFMEAFFRDTYAGKEDQFYSKTLFVCDAQDRPIATCMLWKSYGEFNAIHWFKVLKEYEGRGLGRALLSVIMRDLKPDDYPVYLHTQPGSYRAIKLYSDFGFHLLSGNKFGSRKNDMEEYLPILKEYMPAKDFQRLKIAQPPAGFQEFLETTTTIQF